jgi:hypothetical protein
VFHPEKYSLHIKDPSTSGTLMAASGHITINDEFIVHVTKESQDYEKVGKFIKQFELK